MTLKSSRFTVFAGLCVAVLLCVTFVLWWKSVPRMPEHPYLDIVPEDIGEIKSEGIIFNYEHRAVFWVSAPLPFEVQEIEPLGECPVRRLSFMWEKRRLALIFYAEENLFYESFDAALASSSARASRDERPLIILKSKILPDDKGSVKIRKFRLEGLNCFQIEPELPLVESKLGHVTTYYLFPDGYEPALRAEVYERRNLLDRTPEGVHRVIAGISYPVLVLQPLARMTEAVNAWENGFIDIAMFEATALMCNYRADALRLIIKSSLLLKKLEISRAAVNALSRLPDIPQGEIDAYRHDISLYETRSD